MLCKIKLLNIFDLWIHFKGLKTALNDLKTQPTQQCSVGRAPCVPRAPAGASMRWARHQNKRQRHTLYIGRISYIFAKKDCYWRNSFHIQMWLYKDFGTIVNTFFFLYLFFFSFISWHGMHNYVSSS